MHVLCHKQCHAFIIPEVNCRRVVAWACHLKYKITFYFESTTEVFPLKPGPVSRLKVELLLRSAGHDGGDVNSRTDG